MKDLLEFARNRTVVCLRWHNFLHVRPPTFTDRRLGNRRPAFLVFDLGIAEKLAGSSGSRNIEKFNTPWRLRTASSSGQIGDVSPFIFFLHSAVHRHDESFVLDNCHDRLERIRAFVGLDILRSQSAPVGTSRRRQYSSQTAPKGACLDFFQEREPLRVVSVTFQFA